MKKNVSFEEAMTMLEDAVSKLENGNLTLDAAIGTFEEAIGLIKVCNKKLSEAEQKACVDAIVENVMSNVEDGSIILMHDIYLSTVHATAVILERLHAEGYEVVSVSELLGNAVPGTKYSFN